MRPGPGRPERRTAALLAVVLACALPAAAQQDPREAERRLERVRKELREVASERRRLEGQRGEAVRALRQSDEQVARVARRLRELEAGIGRQDAELAQLRQRRDGLAKAMETQRGELRALLRASYMLGGNVPLKLLLSQDDVAEGARTLAYHGYLQRHRAARIAALRAELAELAEVEREIAARQEELAAARESLRARHAELERERRARNAMVAQLEQRYRDRSEREKALGRDAQSLERLLARLREAARRAEASRRAEAARANGTGTPRRQGGGGARATASAPALQVGGLGWPLPGTLLTPFGARLPDGRSSNGVLIAAAAGTPVRAVADGTVVFAEWMTGYGLILIIDHGNGYMSLYGHNEALLKKVGDRVSRGDVIASVGNSGGQGRSALYFELRRDGRPVNPATWLQKR